MYYIYSAYHQMRLNLDELIIFIKLYIHYNLNFIFEVYHSIGLTIYQVFTEQHVHKLMK